MCERVFVQLSSALLSCSLGSKQLKETRPEKPGKRNRRVSVGDVGFFIEHINQLVTT
jgi:hypothetical protein